LYTIIHLFLFVVHNSTRSDKYSIHHDTQSWGRMDDEERRLRSHGTYIKTRHHSYTIVLEQTSMPCTILLCMSDDESYCVWVMTSLDVCTMTPQSSLDDRIEYARLVITHTQYYSITHCHEVGWATKIYIYLCVYMHIFLCVYMHIYLCVYMHIYACVYMHIYACVYMYVYTCTYMYVYKCIYIYVYTCIYMHVYTCIYTYIYTHIYICISRRAAWGVSGVHAAGMSWVKFAHEYTALFTGYWGFWGKYVYIHIYIYIFRQVEGVLRETSWMNFTYEYIERKIWLFWQDIVLLLGE